MYLMNKADFTINGKPFFIPLGFRVVSDLMPIIRMKHGLKYPRLSHEAKKRLSWMDYHHKTSNVSLTCRHFGISRKTFYCWFKRYNPHDPKTLETRSRAPINRRKPEITPEQKLRVIKLRKKYIRYSKIKLAIIYEKLYGEKISSWKIQRVIQQRNLYYRPIRVARIQRKRLTAQKKKRITELKKEKRAGFLVCADTMTIYWNSLKRYIFTAIDHHSKIAFAHTYTTKSSKNAQDFLKRLRYLYQGKIDNLQTDNGSEFQGYFEQTIKSLPSKIQRYFSRVHTPKDNPVNEHFNGTIKQEFISLGNFTPNVKLFNKRLTEWLVEYNFNRPHQSLGYETPIEFHFKHHKVLPMYPSSAYY